MLICKQRTQRSAATVFKVTFCEFLHLFYLYCMYSVDDKSYRIRTTIALFYRVIFIYRLRKFKV